MNFTKYKNNVMNFLEQCAPSEGVFDEATNSFIPENKVIIKRMSLDERLANNNWAYASTPGGSESLQGSHSALETLYFFGELGRLSEKNKRAWADYFNSFQDKDTGYFIGPHVPPKDHPTFHNDEDYWDFAKDQMLTYLCPTMLLIDAKPRYPLSSGAKSGRFLNKQYFMDYLHGRDWNKQTPWVIGNYYWQAAVILWLITVWEAGTAEAKQARLMLDEVWYRWHDDNMGPTGFWGGDLNGPSELIWHCSLPVGFHTLNPATADEYHWSSNLVMGGIHQLWVYDFENHPIPEKMRKIQTDSALLCQKKNGLFGLSGPDGPDYDNVSCTDVDCATLLAMNYIKQDYRRKEIKASLAKSLTAMLTLKCNKDGVLIATQDRPGNGGFVNAFPTLSNIGQGNMLDQSFYFWAVIACCTVLEPADCPEFSSFIEHDWPQILSPWLWVPKMDRKFK